MLESKYHIYSDDFEEFVRLFFYVGNPAIEQYHPVQNKEFGLESIGGTITIIIIISFSFSTQNK